MMSRQLVANRNFRLRWQASLVGAVIAATMPLASLWAQDAAPADVYLSNGDPDLIRIGPEHVEPGENRYPAKKKIGNSGAVIEFSLIPVPEKARMGPPPPRLSELIGNPARQEALDRAARPGDFVTPPAVWR